MLEAEAGFELGREGGGRVHAYCELVRAASEINQSWFTPAVVMTTYLAYWMNDSQFTAASDARQEKILFLFRSSL